MIKKPIYQKLFTSESVGAGHPDKLCDQIADAILDACLKEDPDSRSAIEVVAFKRIILVCGEAKTKAILNYRQIVEEILLPLGFDQDDFSIIVSINRQSVDISDGVDKKNKKIGAGDQGIKFGYASDETPELMPLPIVIANNLVKKAEQLRKEKKLKQVKPDMKSQVTIDYSNQKPQIETIVFSIQHQKNINKKQLESEILKKVILPIVKQYNLNQNFKLYFNPAGKFEIGGTFSDTGLTGRKIIVDTYGGKGRHGGGAFSGKDYTKMDRSGAYAARWIAKNIIAAKLAKEVEIQISYAIGIEKPISINIETFGTNTISQEKILIAIEKIFDLTPLGIINRLDLKKPIYKQLATYGHFGRNDLDLTWEKTDMVDLLLKTIKEIN